MEAGVIEVWVVIEVFFARLDETFQLLALFG
jgi:hypothetical protein